MKAALPFKMSVGWTLLISLFLAATCTAQEFDPHRIKLPPGFAISVYAFPVPGARSMVLSPKGVLFVGSRSEGKVYAIVDRNSDNRAEDVMVIAKGLHSPNGVAFRGTSLYVAEINRILRFDNIEKRLNNPPSPVVVYDGFPKERHHGWKFISFGPDGLLYVPVGAPCNVCLSPDKIYATITRMHPDGSSPEIYAHGVRNTVGFDWHPKTKELWFTDNGRDWMGSDLPPDELNLAPEKGLHFGFPFCHGASIIDPGYDSRKTCKEFAPPAMELGPHVAALGMRFYTGSMFPKKYYNRIFIAEHGSWNRLAPIGYRITTVTLEGSKAVKYEIFAEGWLVNHSVSGRPVDVLVMPDGALLVSDDRADMIYRITYRQ